LIGHGRWRRQRSVSIDESGHEGASTGIAQHGDLAQLGGLGRWRRRRRGWRLWIVRGGEDPYPCHASVSSGPLRNGGK
jgi:hypothetical protein